MEATPHIRWREATHSEELRQPCIAVLQSSPGTRYVLEQLWKDDSGRCEWRSVSIGAQQPDAVEPAPAPTKSEADTNGRQQTAQISNLETLFKAVANIRK